MFANIYGTNSITIPADMDMSDDNNSTLSSSFQPSTSMESGQFNHYFSQSVPSYQQPFQQQSPTLIHGGLFPQLGSTLPESQQAAFFASTPNENSPSPVAYSPNHHTTSSTNHAGAMSFEDLLTMYYVNNQGGSNNNNAQAQSVAAVAAAAAVAVAGTSPSSFNNNDTGFMQQQGII
jgi:GATA-binding protein